MKSSDYALVWLSRRLKPWLLRGLGEAEDDALAKRLRKLSVDAPVFVTGLARSGTTIMLTLLSQADGVATHRYRDFPFLFLPVAWNWFQDRVGGGPGPAIERPHRDGIRITKESPEAYEEPIWQTFFPWTHDGSRCHVMGPESSNPEFEEFFTSHLRKILWLRGGHRYLSKGNYNVARIGYLGRVFPHARFVVPVRSPFSHVSSLVEQHLLFCRYAQHDPRVPEYLEAAGHYEFGPQRRPINLDPDRIGEIEAAWRDGDNLRGYARQWAQCYAHVDRLRSETPGIGDRIFVVRYEDFCAKPQRLLQQILRFCGLADTAGRVATAATAVTAPQEPEVMDWEAAETVWSEVAVVATRYGYERPPVARQNGSTSTAH